MGLGASAGASAALGASALGAAASGAGAACHYADVSKETNARANLRGGKSEERDRDRLTGITPRKWVI